MKWLRAVGLLALVLSASLGEAAGEKKRSPRRALRAFNELIGPWRCTGEPFGTREEKLKGFWLEKTSWQWQFKGKDVWLLATIDKGKHFTRAELRYLPETDSYQLKMTTTGKEVHTFQGKLERKTLTVERTDPKTKQVQRLVFNLLHFNRHVYRYEVRPPEHTAFTQVYRVGCTKEGIAFAGEDDRPECVVSGGLGTIPVTYKGKTYYVCCSGCRDAFNDDPERWLKDYEASKKKKKAK
jgi:hypothetical protein